MEKLKPSIIPNYNPKFFALNVDMKTKEERMSFIEFAQRNEFYTLKDEKREVISSFADMLEIIRGEESLNIKTKFRYAKFLINLYEEQDIKRGEEIEIKNKRTGETAQVYRDSPYQNYADHLHFFWFSLQEDEINSKETRAEKLNYINDIIYNMEQWGADFEHEDWYNFMERQREYWKEYIEVEGKPTKPEPLKTIPLGARVLLFEYLGFKLPKELGITRQGELLSVLLNGSEKNTLEYLRMNEKNSVHNPKTIKNLATLLNLFDSLGMTELRDKAEREKEELEQKKK